MDILRFLISLICIVAVVVFVFAINWALGLFVVFFGLPAIWYVTGIGAE